jgi:hypothetical protein
MSKGEKVLLPSEDLVDRLFLPDWPGVGLHIVYSQLFLHVGFNGENNASVISREW